MKLTPWEPDLASVVTRIRALDIDLQPEFQRQEVWAVQKKKRLIDTILRGWSFPAVHLIERPDGRMDVLDGQQRLAAIRDFTNEVFAIDGLVTPTDEAVMKLDGLYHGELPPAIKRQFSNYTIRAFRITEYAPEEPRELFYRLNQPTSLTAGEQRNALFGAARDQLKALVALFEQFGNNRDTIGFTNSRMAYDDIIAKLLYFVEQRSFGIKSSETLISERFKVTREFDSAIVARCALAIERFSLARNVFLKHRFNKASILSWLLFFVRDGVEVPPSFVRDFIEIPSRHFGHDLNAAFQLFSDRASLRVSDVSSVVFRDFCLWYACARITQVFPANQMARDVVAIVRDDVISRDDISFHHAVSQRLNLQLWSGTL